MATLSQNFLEVLLYPVALNERIHWAYLLTSFAFAAWLLRRRSGSLKGLLGFLFPAEVWQRESAWLDVRYFFVHQIVRVWIYGAFVLSTAVATFRVCSPRLAALLGTAESSGPFSVATLVALTLGLALAADAAAWGIHVLQHRSPLLWEFHKVHHSAEVMHPLTNYREHPVDNLAYALGTGVTYGLIGAATFRGLPFHQLPTYEILGVGLFKLVFNLGAYNLRHSHIWLAWPTPIGALFGSPAYHQLHHSQALEHRDKNYGFLFPFWDRLIGAQVMPTQEPTALQYGLGDGTESQYSSVFRLYFLPVRNAFRLLLWRPQDPPGPN
jgi:sterol desaturase/sphingolipid hydroxylase (fatty acid hydroxylase superfamily)